jgi:Ca-activated chloride channel homolog
VSLPFGLGMLGVATPGLLLALLALPLFFLGAGRERHELGAPTCRALAAAALVLTLAGLHVERDAPEVGSCIVAAIDVSASVRRGAVETAATYLADLLPRLGPRDLVGSLAFAARAHVIRRPEAPPRDVAALLPPATPSPTGVEAGDTDIAQAIATAAPLCPAGRQAALLLFTDGNETQGSLLAEAALTEPRVPIFPIVPAPGVLPPALIRRVLAPAIAPEHSVLPLEVVVESRAAGTLQAALALSANGTPLAREPVALPPGLSVIALPHRLRGAGHYLLETALVLPEPAETGAGPTRTALTVTRPLHVLVVSERRVPAVARALGKRGLQVEIVAPDVLARRSLRLADTHVVVLDDVAHASLGDAALERLAAFVAHGGGLVVTGGRHLFGDAGFAASPLARLLPVELLSQSPEPREREPIALYLVIDRSNSMGYASREPTVQNSEKMIYAKRAALAVLDQLGARDLVGAIAFDSRPYELGPLCPVDACRATLETRIAQLQHGGGTDFKEALDIARRNLIESGRRVRHVILLTDGDTNRGPEDHAGLIAALARAEITVTTIRVGSDTINVDLLASISRATGGEFHHVEDAHALPQLMIRDTQRLMRDPAAHRAFPVHVGTPGHLLAGLAEAELPTVSRWAFTRVRRGAEVRLYVAVGEERDPLLATWQYELGRVAVIPVDFQSGAAAWPAWDGFGKLWTQLVAWAAPAGLAGDRHLEVERQPDGTLIRLRTLADGQGPFALHLPSVGDVRLRQTGARVFSATVPDLDAGLHRAVLLSESDGALVEEPLALMVPATSDNGREYRGAAPDLALLSAVAALTEGAVAPPPRAVLAVRAGFARESRALDWLLVPAALLLLLADVALRRRAP